MTGRPRNSGWSRCSTEAKNASISTWKIMELLNLLGLVEVLELLGVVKLVRIFQGVGIAGIDALFLDARHLALTGELGEVGALLDLVAFARVGLRGLRVFFFLAEICVVVIGAIDHDGCTVGVIAAKAQVGRSLLSRGRVIFWGAMLSGGLSRLSLRFLGLILRVVRARGGLGWRGARRAEDKTEEHTSEL